MCDEVVTRCEMSPDLIRCDDGPCSHTAASVSDGDVTALRRVCVNPPTLHIDDWDCGLWNRACDCGL